MGSNILEKQLFQDGNHDWAPELRSAIRGFIKSRSSLDHSHTVNTPTRFVDALIEMTSGLDSDENEILGTRFSADNCDQMVHRSNISVISLCGHHMIPFIGKAHFAYLPDQSIVGLSKIPRLIRMHSKRLQVQEYLTHQIVDSFQRVVQPHGCGLVIRAYHFCEICRGAQEPAALTETSALRGSFKNELTRVEFIGSINRNEPVFP